jgi:flagellar protein FlaI
MAETLMKSPLALKITRRMREGYLVTLKRERILNRPMSSEKMVQFFPYPYPGFQPPEKHVKPPEEKKEKIIGINISEDIGSAGVPPPVKPEEGSRLKDFKMTYSLIPRKPAQGERVYAYADIRWNPKFGELVYYVVEPEISQYDNDIIESTKKILEERLDIDFFKVGEIKAKNLLREEIYRILRTRPDMDQGKIDSIRYCLERDIVGMGKVEPMFNDPNIEDISCDGINIPIYVYHRNPGLGSLKTNVVFTTEEELNSFVVKMAQRARKSISIAEPLLDASLPDGSRIQATLGTDIARKGSNFTIRKFAEKPLTPIHMLRYGTLNSTQIAYLWLAIDNGKSILISGGTATGKTSLLNALSLFIRPNLKIVSIEDTPELRLPHPHWIPEVARTPLSFKGSVGEVSLFDLLKSSLRQRPDYIVMGEVRGKEAFVLFQQMATGHSSIATIHAATITQLVDRLTTPPISLPPSLLENIDIIVFLTLTRLGGKYVRRADKILEVTGVKDNVPMANTVFSWKPSEDSFKTDEKSVTLRSIAERQALDETELKDELARRKGVIEWMYKQEIYDYREVARIISTYYTNPERVMTVIGES